MEKIQKTMEISYPINWGGETLISIVRADLDELEKLGATYISIEAENDYGLASLDIVGKYRRPETDQELNQRIEAGKKREDYIKKQDLEQIERLKLKYNL